MTSRPATTATTDSRVEHENTALFVLVLTYTSPLPAIDTVMPAHRRFLDEFFASSEFLASGPREPRVGGVILARATDRTRVDELIAADPFTQRGLASYDVIAFVVRTEPRPVRTSTARHHAGVQLDGRHQWRHRGGAGWRRDY